MYSFYFSGTTGSMMQEAWSGPQCSVTFFPNISSGLSVGSSCKNGPQP